MIMIRHSNNTDNNSSNNNDNETGRASREDPAGRRLRL